MEEWGEEAELAVEDEDEAAPGGLPDEDGEFGEEAELEASDEEEAGGGAWEDEADGAPGFMDADDIEEPDAGDELPTDPGEEEGDEAGDDEGDGSEPGDYTEEDGDDPLTGGE